MISVLLLLAQVAGPAQEESGSGGVGAATSFRIVPRCDRSAEGEEIVVCGRRDEAERYRLPIRPDGFDKNGHIPSVSRERHRLYEVGETGLYSCSNVGPGGYTGCDFKNWKAKLEQHGK